jgi:flagellar M-ring protein FliF
MPSQVRGALQSALHAIREFTVAQRTLALIGLAVLVVGGIAVGGWLLRPQYAPLYSGLAGSDASAIVDQLDSAKVPYELTDGGTTIMVPPPPASRRRTPAATRCSTRWGSPRASSSRT